MLKHKERMLWIFLVVFTLATSFFSFRPAGEAKAQERERIEDLQNYMRLFQRTFNTLKENYVDETKVKTKDLYYGAIKGMLDSVGDPYTSFMDEKVSENLSIEISGEYGGLGMYLNKDDNDRLLIVAPIEDTPAERAGIQPGDIIAKIEDESTDGMSTDDAVKRMRGKPNTDVTITIYREGVTDLFPVTMTRALIHVKSVKSEMLSDKTGYFRLTTFGESTPEELETAVKELKAQGMQSMIIDLRNNPGGLLPTAITVADMFLKNGKIVYTRGRNSGANSDFYADRGRNAFPGDIAETIPMAILVNQYSASASEIVTGALQDHGRATVIGERTFGKFSVQTVEPLEPNNPKSSASIKYTVAYYYTPNGRRLHDEGIQPDILIQEEEITKEDVTAFTKIIEGKYIEAYAEKTKTDTDASIKKFQEELKTKGVDARFDFLKRLVHNHRIKNDYKRVVDVEYDKKLQFALDFLAGRKTAKDAPQPRPDKRDEAKEQK